MARVLLTGAAGFTGRYLAEALAHRGHEVHGVLHLPEQEPIPGISQCYVADLCDLKTLNRVVGKVRPNHVVHLAAISFVAHGNAEQIYRTNIFGTRQLLEALTTVSEAPSSVLLASSANIYGNAREGVLDETVPPAPANDYAVSKLAMEYVAKLYSSRLPIVVVRPFNYTGVGQDPNFLLPKIVAHARQGARTVELGNLDVARDFSDVRTVVDAYTRLLETPTAIGEIYNVCSGQAISLKTVVETVARLSGHELDVKVNAAFIRPNEVRMLTGSPAKLEKAIGPLKGVPLEETLSWMLQA
jgi:nucleoside-diphosphate-sugar epimerase